MEKTKVWGSLFGSTIGKIVAGIIAAIGISGVIFILVLQANIANLERDKLVQQQMIQAQHQRIQALELQTRLDQAANEILNERLRTRQLEVDNLTNEIESIYAQGDENDGPVAPVLDNVVRGGGIRAPR